MNDLKQLIVTGASSELGNILVRELAKDPQCMLIGTMRRALRPHDKYPSNVIIIDRCDLTDVACCRKMARIAGRKFKGPFGFIHSVGDFWDHVPFLDFKSERAAGMFASHVTTFYNSLQALIPLMVSARGGSCITFSCNSVRYNYPWMASFTASKSAVDSLVRSLANEYAGKDLRFNSLVLASVKTKKVRHSKPHGDFAHFIPPKDIVPVIKFLLSEDSYLVNGNSIHLFQHSDRFYRQGYFERIAK